MTPSPGRSWPVVGRGALASSWIVLPLVAALLLPLVWPLRSNPGRLFDVSWMVALHQAATGGLEFGREIVFTYGPLGFLLRPVPFVGATTALAFPITALVYLAALVALLRAARRHLPLVAAAALTLAFGRAFVHVEPFEALTILAFACAVELLRKDRVVRPDWVAAAAGTLAAAAVLGKLNGGVFITAMAVVVVLAISPSRPRGLAVLGAAFAVVGLGLWLATGQPLGNLVAYGAASFDIIAGYSESMGTWQPGMGWLYPAFGLVAALIAWATWGMAAPWPGPRRLALAALVLLVLFAAWKFAFVRIHVASAFATLAFATLFLLSPRVPRTTVLVALVAVSLAYLGASRLPVTQYLGAPAAAIEFARQLRTTVMPWRWDDATEVTRARLRAAFQIPPELLAQLDGRTVHIDPWSADVITAYPGMTWRPLPVFQTYSAYTPSLDDLNADLLRSDRRPERILRQGTPTTLPDEPDARATSIDGRFAWWESPAATVERVCRYTETAVTPDWQVLADSGRACGEERPLGSVTAAWGEPVAVPTAPDAGDLVLVRIHGVEDGIPARLRASLWRAPDWFAVLDGIRYRLVPGTAAQTLVLAIPAAAQGSPPFAFGAPVGTIAVYPSGSDGGGRLTYEFITMSLPGD